MQYRSSTSVDSTSTNDLSLTCSVPAGVIDGDMLILTISSDILGFSTATVTGLEAWTERTTGEHGTECPGRLWTRIASSEPSNYTPVSDTSAIGVVRITAYDPEGGVAQVDDGANVGFLNTFSAFSTSAPVTVKLGGILHIEFIVDNYRTPVITPPPGMTLIEMNEPASTMSSGGYYEATSGVGLTRQIRWNNTESSETLAIAISAPPPINTMFLRSTGGKPMIVSPTGPKSVVIR